MVSRLPSHPRYQLRFAHLSFKSESARVGMAQIRGLCRIFAPAMPKFFIKTYGCQMNERDSEQVAHSLIARGYEATANEAEADVVLLNTCSVRDMADQKALGKMGMLGHLAKAAAGSGVRFSWLHGAGARRRVCCADLPHVDLVVGTQKFHRVADYVEDACSEENRADESTRWTIHAFPSSTC